MNWRDPAFLLKLTLAVTMLAHSVPVMINGGVNAFGRSFLDPAGFAPFGLPLAWAIKLSHVAMAAALVSGRFLKPLGWITISVLVGGIIMVHGREGWFVVGGGRNGVEFNVLLIAAFLTVMYPDGLKRR
jgi:putative oxidoreductase